MAGAVLGQLEDPGRLYGLALLHVLLARRDSHHRHCQQRHYPEHHRRLHLVPLAETESGPRTRQLPLRISHVLIKPLRKNYLNYVKSMTVLSLNKICLIPTRYM